MIILSKGNHESRNNRNIQSSRHPAYIQNSTKPFIIRYFQPIGKWNFFFFEFTIQSLWKQNQKRVYKNQTHFLITKFFESLFFIKKKKLFESFWKIYWQLLSSQKLKIKILSFSISFSNKFQSENCSHFVYLFLLEDEYYIS
jgi:hypothetical protein